MVHDTQSLTRRTALRSIGATVVGVSIAGCAQQQTNTASGSTGEADYVDSEPNYEGWFEDVDTYDGTIDKTGSDTVTVDVGAADGLSFAPPAVAVSPNTTITWQWTGNGGQHNVVEETGTFESDLVAEGGHTFERTFDDQGVFRYSCKPHESQGMKGAIVVESE